MRVLCIIPPYVPSYFNAGHHLGIFSVAAYLRRSRPDAVVEALDAAALNMTWRDICRVLVKGYDLVVMWNDFDGIDTFGRFIRYVRELSPQSRLMTCGRAGSYARDLFEALGFDAIAISGDPEAAVDSYVAAMVGDAQPPAGVALRGTDGAYADPVPGRYLPSEKWAMPDVREIPYEAYDRLYRDDLNKFCGIPEKRELVVQVARGCPVGCDFCDVPALQGLKERRLSPAAVIGYIGEAMRLRPFEYVSFYAPTFTLRRRWVVELCEALAALGGGIRWKCVTTLSHLDEALIGLMAESGCIRISVGLETLGAGAASLPKPKRDARGVLEAAATACNRHGVELNCFVIVGLPGDRPEDTRETVRIARSLGARIRPTVYTPYHEMPSGLDVEGFNRYNRQLFECGEPAAPVRAELYRQMYADPDDAPTEIGGEVWRLSGTASVS